MATNEELRLKIFMCFINFSEENRRITKMAQALGVEKYEMSRQVAQLEKEGYVDRSDPRSPKLTEKGRKLAEGYTRRMELAQNHLIYEGVPKEEARHDAIMLTLYCGDKTFENIQRMEETLRMKEIFADKPNFSGREFSEEINEGHYTFPFIIYREKVKKGNNISMANKGFAHPCEVIVGEGGGFVLLKAVDMDEISGFSGLKMKGRVRHLKYFDGKQFIEAAVNGDFIQIPLDYFQFHSIGDDSLNRILHGSICLKMCCSVGQVHMPESTAIFTLFVH